MSTQPPQNESTFLAEVERIRRSGTLGEAGRLAELFEYLAARGYAAGAATQAEIAEAVFGQTETTIDDATVRVYIHRLRKRLEEFYRSEGESVPRLTVPAGTYALRLAPEEAPVEEPVGQPASIPMPLSQPRRSSPWGWALLGLVLLAGAFALGRALPTRSSGAANAFWQPLMASQRPTLIVLGDYYIFGEIDPVRPEEGRLIRDFQVNSALDLVRMREVMPERYATAEDVGLNYLPFSAGYAMQAIMPILSSTGRPVRVVAASALEPDMLNEYDIVYIGLFSAMGLLEDVNFDGSGFHLGESYDELVDTGTGRSYVSEEGRRVASPGYYQDYGYVARFRAPSGALVAIVAGMRETGLRGIAPLISGAELPRQMEEPAESGAFEALYQITGQQGADLSEQLLVARARPAAR